ncbi:hypothetical protein JTE90_018929 [Oedothorax gibbosus]|uniref:Actin n=1 Tax=Oedothorax gibbosus TaxID=931172 RepID=A0AAV6VTW5_9ARAC|nr:hypothetical protein JTE90_018929 [Oedothorax gibbosus]
MSEALHTLAAFAEMLDVAESIGEWFGKKAYSSQSTNTESKKDIHFDPWTTDSSGIGTDLTNDSRTNESASSRSSTPIDNNILDDCLGTDKQTNEENVSKTSCADIKPIEKNITALEENAHPITIAEDSYTRCIEANIKPSLSIEGNSVNIECEYFNNETNDNKPSSEENSAKIYSENSIPKTNESKSEETSNKINVNTCDSNIDKTNTSEDIDKVHDIKKVPSNQIVDESEEHGRKKFTTSSWNLESITESLYAIAEPTSLKVSSSSIQVDEIDGISLEFPNVRVSSESSSIDKGSTEPLLLEENTTVQTVFVLNEGIFVQYSPGHYILKLQEHRLQIKEETNTLISIPLTYAEVTRLPNNVLKVDNRLGKCLFFKTDTQKELTELSQLLQIHSSRVWTSEPLQLVHYPMKCHKNVVIVDLGSCSTRAGILMDQPTLPFLFFPSICATDRKTGNHVYGKEALQSKVRQNSNLSFPLRPSVKIIKHSIDIDLIGGLFKMIFQQLRVDPTQYVVQVCLPRTLSISSQDAIVKLLLEDVKVEAVSLTHQALLTLYAHKASTGIVVDIGDRMDILPVVDGFIVDGGVTRLTYGGQRLIHHMKHALAQKHISLSNDIDSFVVQYISENLSYVAEDYNSEVQIASKYPDMVKKTIALNTFAKDDKCAQSATLDDARFKTPEGLFQPELWGLDSPGIHKLVHKAIHATGVDVRKKIAEHIYVSGGVTMIPGFVERLLKEVSDLNKPKIVPKVIASNYRYHCTYIGACEFAKMDVFPKVCVNFEEYTSESHPVSLTSSVP